MRAIQEIFLALGAVIQNHGKTAGSRDHKLIQRFVRMPAAHGARRNVVKIIRALDHKRNVTMAFNKRQISARFFHDWEVDDLGALPLHQLLDNPFQFLRSRHVLRVKRPIHFHPFAPNPLFPSYRSVRC